MATPDSGTDVEAYDPLSTLDESFLAFETPNAYMHVALTALFESGSLATPNGGVDIGKVRAHIASRLHLIPRYRQRLKWVPLLDDAVWVDDDNFDLTYHVRHTSVPRPGTEAQLKHRVAEILEQPLDRSRPLWEIWIIEGLAGGRFALHAKVHHCMVDGVAGIDLLPVLLGLVPSDEPDRSKPWQPRPAPSDGRLLRREVVRRGGETLRGLRGWTDALLHPARFNEEIRTRAGAAYRLLSDGLSGAPETPLNPPIGPHRRVHWVSFDLSEVKAAKDQLGATVNDVVLSTVAGAVRRFLAARPEAEMPERFQALVPVNVRSSNERGRLGNRISMWVVPLPLREMNPLCRVEAIRAATERLKTGRQVLGAEMLIEAAGWTTARIRNAAARLVGRTRAFNVIVTNVPGPQTPLYLLGARMVAGYPHVPLFANQAMGLALLSYDGTLSWGITGDREHLADIEEFGNALTESFAEFARAAAPPRRLQATSTRLRSRTVPAPGRRRAAKPRRPTPARAAANGRLVGV